MRKNGFLAVIFLILIICVAFAAYLFNRNYVVPILMYHSVCPNPDPQNKLALSPEVFELQMSFLKEYNKVITLEELAASIRENKPIPANAVVITFDDGYADNYRYAFPVLKKYNFSAAIFLIVNEVGRPQNDRLSWKEIEEMQASGLITFGSHCLGPEPLVNISSGSELRKQISDSKKILEEKLGKKVAAFSYPEGKFNQRIRQQVIAAGYTLAVATNPGKEFPDKDRFVLKRLRISSNAKNLFIFWVETSGYYNFMRENRHR
ncbi:MAG: polysaccharide deacetylase family protein [Candidatus Omnitrophota bacterium]